ncbi:MAG: DUF4249 family protein [Bacteroidetes bacterium]|jgi:hypothetical protein|nr:DUF4249 family protein [Bacteroidota bacterium]
MRYTVFLLLISHFFLSCEREITFQLEQPSPKLVVEAFIENGEPPFVFLTSSLAYYATVSLPILNESLVKDAEVSIEFSGTRYPLRGHTASGPASLLGYFYTVDSVAQQPALRGALRGSYKLTIRWKGETYTAATTIPDTTRTIDSIFWKWPPPGNPPGKVAVYVRAKDRPGLGDYIRYFTKQNNGPFLPGFNSVFDDQIIDGTTYEVQVERGVIRTGELEEGYALFNRGDTVQLKLCTIDKATYDFWRTTEFNFASVGNPFSSPTRVLSNLSNGALGYFGGYAVQYRRLLIPR